jgi:hypothetical protein
MSAFSGQADMAVRKERFRTMELLGQSFIPCERLLGERSSWTMSVGTIILIILVLLLLGGFSGWGGGPFYGTGYYGGGGLGLVIVILLILILMGRI